MNLFRRIRRYIDFKRRGIKVWRPCNIYATAKIGNNVSIGRFSEIGHNVEIGEGTRIGMGTFIPEGVWIGKNCFIGPRACFSNDIYPPSPQKEWKVTIVMDGARIGANASILPGIIINCDALIGMGAVVNRCVPKGEIWAGVPARKLRKEK